MHVGRGSQGARGLRLWAAWQGGLRRPGSGKGIRFCSEHQLSGLQPGLNILPENASVFIKSDSCGFWPLTEKICFPKPTGRNLYGPEGHGSWYPDSGGRWPEEAQARLLVLHSELPATPATPFQLRWALALSLSLSVISSEETLESDWMCAVGPFLPC